MTAHPPSGSKSGKLDPAARRRANARPTIRDVAEAAGVTIGTVSKALNQNGSLKAETRERVIEAAQKIGFRPNDLAQALHRGQSFTVGLLSNDSFGRFTMPIMEGLEAVLAEAGIAVFMCNATDDPQRERQHIEQLMGKRVDGLVVTSRRADHRPGVDLGDIELPLVYVFAQSDNPNSVSLLPDDKGGARLGVEHLISIGRRRIAHVTGPEHFEAVQLRRDGYLEALEAANMTPDPALYRSGKWSEAFGREAVETLFADPGRAPDALFCGNDQIARGCADALRERGIVVPDEVSIVGFDNWEVMTNSTRPPLTSVDMNLHDLGREAAKRLMAMIDHQTFSGVHRLPCSLVVRESCGAHIRPKNNRE